VKNETERNILRTLCKNSRATLEEVTSEAKCSKPTAIKCIREVEKAYTLHHTIEFSPEKLELKQFIIAVKTQKPITKEDAEQAFKSSYVPQMIAICEGDFNLLIFAVARTSLDYIGWADAFRRNLNVWGKGPVFWKASEVFFERLGGIVLRDEVFDKLDLNEKTRELLREINQNSRQRLNFVAKRIKVSPAAAKYLLEKTMKKGIVKRFTSVIGKRMPGFDVAFFIEKPFLPDHPERAEKTRRMYFQECSANLTKKSRDMYFRDDGQSQLNRYQMVQEIFGSADQFNLTHFNAMDDWYVEKNKTVENFGSGRTGITSGIIVKILAGELMQRNLDVPSIYDTTLSWETLLNLKD